MLDIGLQELLLILVIALLVFGPKRLPELGRAVGRAMREFKRASDEFRSTIETNLQLNEPDPVPYSSPSSVAEPPAPAPVEAPTGAAPESLPTPQTEEVVCHAEPFLAQRGGRLFHTRQCSWTARITEAERVYFKQADEAREQGFSPCPVCEPY